MHKNVLWIAVIVILCLLLSLYIYAENGHFYLLF